LEGPKMTKTSLRAVALTVVLLATPAFAQESVSIAGGLPGDAVSPWADATAPLGSEQCNNYVVDLTPFLSFADTPFGIAPIIKASKTSSDFFCSMLSAQSISRLQHMNVPFHAGSYGLWNDAGYGVNNNPSINTPGTPVSTSELLGNQFATVFAEFSTTDTGANYNGIISGFVNYLPSDPARLYVSRINAAVNSCDNASNYAKFGIGSVDEDGHIHFRCDDDGATGGNCTFNGTPLHKFGTDMNNIFRLSMADRDCDILNVISDDYLAGGLFDLPATPEWLIRNTTIVHNTPNTMPSSVTGGVPLYLGGNFNGQYVRGPAFGSITSDQTHLNLASMTDHRGNFGYTTRNCDLLNSTHGMGGVLAYDLNDETTMISLFGLDGNGDVTGVLPLTLPAVITDVTTGQTNWDGLNEFNHYHSQTAFLGGNAPVALGKDQQGNLLVAAEVDHPISPASYYDVNYIAVARVDCATGEEKWTMAGWTTYEDGPLEGKPFFDSTGTAIGEMTVLSMVTGGDPFGPSVSAPMIDSAGNVWFLSAIEMYNPLGNPGYTTGLLRGVYSADYMGTGEPGYVLELVFLAGQVFHGQNSNRDYKIIFLGIADNDSVDSGTAWSSNMSETAHLGGPCPIGYDTKDPWTLGGVVVRVTILYDQNNDGEFIKATGAGGDPESPDEDYNVLLYVGAACGGVPDTNRDGDVDLADFAKFQSCFTGAGSGPVLDACKVADLDCDTDVDLDDYENFVRTLRGPM
jgi:hypothetical protein